MCVGGLVPETCLSRSPTPHSQPHKPGRIHWFALQVVNIDRATPQLPAEEHESLISPPTDPTAPKEQRLIVLSDEEPPKKTFRCEYVYPSPA